MRRLTPARSKHPIGARWRAVDDRGCVAEIYLERREEGLEFWRWTFRYKDDSGADSDWAPSYRTCQQEVGYKLQGKVRFKRVDPVQS